jgi:hypothetical protein
MRVEIDIGIPVVKLVRLVLRHQQFYLELEQRSTKIYHANGGPTRFCLGGCCPLLLESIKGIYRRLFPKISPKSLSAYALAIRKGPYNNNASANLDHFISEWMEI